MACISSGVYYCSGYHVLSRRTRLWFIASRLFLVLFALLKNYGDCFGVLACAACPLSAVCRRVPGMADQVHCPCATKTTWNGTQCLRDDAKDACLGIDCTESEKDCTLNEEMAVVDCKCKPGTNLVGSKCCKLDNPARIMSRKRSFHSPHQHLFVCGQHEEQIICLFFHFLRKYIGLSKSTGLYNSILFI